MSLGCGSWSYTATWTISNPCAIPIASYSYSWIHLHHFTHCCLTHQLWYFFLQDFCSSTIETRLCVYTGAHAGWGLITTQKPLTPAVSILFIPDHGAWSVAFQPPGLSHCSLFINNHEHRKREWQRCSLRLILIWEEQFHHSAARGQNGHFITNHRFPSLVLENTLFCTFECSSALIHLNSSNN